MLHCSMAQSSGLRNYNCVAQAIKPVALNFVTDVSSWFPDNSSTEIHYKSPLKLDPFH